MQYAGQNEQGAVYARLVKPHSAVKDLLTIEASYAELDRFLDNLSEASSGGIEDAIKEKLSINDQAYFILAWGQLERAIDDACRRAIENGRNQRNWRQRRAWSIYNPEDRRLSGLRFEDRVALVLNPDSEGEEYALTMQHYNLRNQIAHGTLLSRRIEVTEVIEQFFVIQAALTTLTRIRIHP